MSMPSKTWLLLVLAGLMLAGCASLEEISKKISDSQTQADEALARQSQMRKSGAVVRMSGAKLAGEEISVKRTGQLPAVFSRPFSYLSAHQPLSAILGEIGRRVGVGTAIQPPDQNAAGTSAASGQPASTATATTTGLPNFSGGQDTPIAVDWNGDLKGLLDYLATTTRMFWKFEDGRIYFFRTETRTFHVFLPGGKRTVKSTISLTGSNNSSSSGSSSGSSSSSSSSGSTGSSEGGTVDVSSNIDIDAYEAIIKSVQAIVSTSEGMQNTGTPGAPAAAGQTGSTASSRSVVANPSLGIVTVTATPAILDRVASYIKSINERFAQNVMIGVKIYNLTVKKDINAGASLTLAYRDVAKKMGVTLTGAPNLAAANGATAGTLVVDKLTGSQWSGSQLILQALEQLGDVQYVTSGQVIAANGQPSPLQVATEFTYLASRSTSQTVNVGSTTTLTPGSRTVGFTANFLPLILGDNRIMLQYQINLSALLSLDTFGNGNDTIQIPKVSTQSLQQQAFVKDGQSIVLLGFEQERSTADKSFGLTGLSRNGGSERNLMVIVMEVFSGK